MIGEPKKLLSSQLELEARRLRREDAVLMENVRASVLEIIEMVRKNGDSALLELTERFDGVRVEKPLLLGRDVLEDACRKCDTGFVDALRRSIERVMGYHEKEKENSWFEATGFGVRGLLKVPLDRVGVYVPGGKAIYPSTVIMTCIPARVAGVKEIYGFTPPSPDGFPPKETLAAFYLCGAHGVYRVGGAQAVAAAAFGTESVKRMDKIVGPGNIYVATAKKELFGSVGIDSIAGPSEVLIVSDEKQDPHLLSLDLLSQLEHDPQARAILLSTSEDLIKRVLKGVQAMTERAERRDILKRSIKNLFAYVVDSIKYALEFSNHYCPEHLQLAVDDPMSLIPLVRCAGAVFLGKNTPVPFGDYCAGPNHVLPTGGSARFSSPLGVHDFYRRIGLLYLNARGVELLAEDVNLLSKIEGLHLHGESAVARRKR